MKNSLIVIITTLVTLAIVGVLVSTNMSDDTKTADATTTEETADTEKKEVVINEKTLGQTINPLPTPDYITLGGEEAPLHQYDIRERLDRELLVNTYWHSSMIRMLKQANRYFPTIEPILAEHGVPDDFKYLAVAESDLRLKTSYAGAKGYWQFMKASGKQYKLEINDEVDERYHLEKSTRAAAKYIKYLNKRFGGWVNAAAAYNIGPTRYNRITKQQGSVNYFDLNLNDETSRYVFRILAFKYILSNPEKYGFIIHDNEKYQPLDDFYTVKIDKSVPSWTSFAEEKGISYRDLKVYNPWLIDNKLTVINNTYFIKVPKA